MTAPDRLAEIERIFAARDRAHMQPTIDAFEQMLADDPEDPRLLYEVGGAYDTDGQEERAVGFYERALELGLDGDVRRRCLLQYGSTLRNLDRLDDSRAIFEKGVAEYPDSPSLKVFKALTDHAAGDLNASVGTLLAVIADLDHSEIERYRAAIAGNAEYVLGLS